MMDYKLLEECPIYKGILANEIKSLFEQIHFKVKEFNRAEIIFMAGEPVKHLHIVVSGSVKGEMIDYSGKTIKIEDVEAPRPLAAAFLFGKNNCFPVTVTANNNVKMLSVPVGDFLKLLQSNTQILLNYLHSISSRSQFLSQKIHFLSFKTIKEKVAHFLLQNAGSDLHSVELKFTQQHLAELFGVARPSLARVLSEMQNEKLIRIERKTITLLNKKMLREILQDG